jgi:hypothetical protein
MSLFASIINLASRKYNIIAHPIKYNDEDTLEEKLNTAY